MIGAARASRGFALLAVQPSGFKSDSVHPLGWTDVAYEAAVTWRTERAIIGSFALRPVPEVCACDSKQSTFSKSVEGRTGCAEIRGTNSGSGSVVPLPKTISSNYAYGHACCKRRREDR